MLTLTEKDSLTPLKLADLHVHLGATTSGHILWEIAHHQGIKLPTKNYWDFIKQMGFQGNMEHNKYLDKFKLTHMIQSSPMAVERSVYNAISSAYRKCNITTIEVRMNPILRNKDGFYDLDAIIYHATIGMHKACLQYPVKAGLILAIEREFDEVKAGVIVEKAIKYMAHGVVGIDVSGRSPKDFKVDTFIKAFNTAKEAGLGTTFHTGEVYGSEEMMEVVKKIKPDRIGHGVKCIEDKKLINLVRDNDIILEICPTSNLRLGIIKDIDDLHKILDTLKHNKIKFCINSDGPVFLDVSVNDEFVMLYQNKIFDGGEIEQLVRESHSYTFIGNGKKN